MKCVICKEQKASGRHILTHPNLEVSVMPIAHHFNDFTGYTVVTSDMESNGWKEAIICEECLRKI